jgi:hypothetical protein
MRAGVKYGFLWRNGVFTDLEQTAAAQDIFSTVAGGITDSGQIVGYALQNGTAETLGFITSALHQAPDDFTGDNRSDLLWRQSNGGLALWQMNGAGIVSSVVTSGGNPVAPDSSWSMVGTGNFFFNSGIGTADVLWRQSGGGLALWNVNGVSGAITSSMVKDLSTNQVVTPDSSWSVAATSDFTGDGTTDVLWRQAGAGLSLWQMDGRTIMSGNSVTYQGSAVTPDASWSIAATGDFTGDGRPTSCGGNRRARSRSGRWTVRPSARAARSPMAAVRWHLTRHGPLPAWATLMVMVMSMCSGGKSRPAHLPNG